MSGLVETVLNQTRPTAVFTMTIAAAIGALAAPAAIAGGIFGTTATAGAGASSLSSELLAAMSTTKTSIITAALVAAACIPVGYRVAAHRGPALDHHLVGETRFGSNAAPPEIPPGFETSAIFAEWRRLHEVHGSSAESMPMIYEAIAAIRDPFRRRAFRAALISEWVQVDANGGFRFLLSQSDTTQRRQFFQEWLARDADAAVDELMLNDPGWESVARALLTDIARKAPGRVAAIGERLPATTSYWETTVRDAFAIVAEGSIEATRAVAEQLGGPHREQALGGVALAWAKKDIRSAIAWARALPGKVDRDELVRAALMGKAVVDPASALEQVGIVPPGGRENYFATTTGARVLRAAADADYDSTIAWIAANPGRLGREDLMGIANVVTDRLNADPVAFLNRHVADNSLLAILPAINSALLNEAGGQRAAIWKWLQGQPDTEATRHLRREVMQTAGDQDPVLALKFAQDLSPANTSEAQLREITAALFNSGDNLHRFDILIEQAPEWMRPQLLGNAFRRLREGTLTDPQTWAKRLSDVPEPNRPEAMHTLAQAWGAQSPEEAIAWAGSLPDEKSRHETTAAVVAIWAAKDARSAAGWVNMLPAGLERDRSVSALAISLFDSDPGRAWEWTHTIQNAQERGQAVAQIIHRAAARDPVTARQWIESAEIAPELKHQLRATVERRAVGTSTSVTP
jgi:hypothetical protein